MGWIKNGPKKKSSRFFVRQHLLAKTNSFFLDLSVLFAVATCHILRRKDHSLMELKKIYRIFSSAFTRWQRKITIAHFFAVVQFVLQLCHIFCSCVFCFADVLKLYIIPTYNFADVQMK
jgi:hypothetical protein